MDTKLSQHLDLHEKRVIATIPTWPQNLGLSFKPASLLCGYRWNRLDEPILMGLEPTSAIKFKIRVPFLKCVPTVWLYKYNVLNILSLVQMAVILMYAFYQLALHLSSSFCRPPFLDAQLSSNSFSHHSTHFKRSFFITEPQCCKWPCLHTS